MGNCVGISGINPNSSAALGFAGTAIIEVWNLANDAYTKAKGLIDQIAAVVDLGSVDTTITTDQPGELPDVSEYLTDIPTPPDLSDIPDPPTLSYDYNESPYISDLGDALNNALLYEIQNGSTGLTATVENDMYNRESERDLQELADTKMRIAADWAESNSPLVDDVLYAQLTRADIEYQNRYSDKSRDVRIESFKRADDNAKFVKNLAMQYESVIRQYMGNYWERQLKKASEILHYAEVVYDLLIKGKLARVELYKAQAQAYEAQAKAIAAIAGVQIASYEALVKWITAQADIQMKGIEAQIELLKAKVQAAIAAADSIGKVASTLAAGALSALHAGVTVGYDGKESISTSGDVKVQCTDWYQHEVVTTG